MALCRSRLTVLERPPGCALPHAICSGVRETVVVFTFRMEGRPGLREGLNRIGIRAKLVGEKRFLYKILHLSNLIVN